MSLQKLLSLLDEKEIQELDLIIRPLNVIEKYLNSCIKKGKLNIIKHILENYPEIKIDLNLACRKGNLPTVIYLVERGAKINTCYPLITACSEGDLPIVKYLVENGAYIRTSGCQAIRNAGLFGHLDVLKYLIVKTPNLKISHQRYILSGAFPWEQIHIVNYLLTIFDLLDYVPKDFVLKFYTPNNIDNILRLYSLYSMKINISKFQGITVEDINTLIAKYIFIEDNLKLTICNKNIRTIIKEYIA